MKHAKAQHSNFLNHWPIAALCALGTIPALSHAASPSNALATASAESAESAIPTKHSAPSIPNKAIQSSLTAASQAHQFDVPALTVLSQPTTSDPAAAPRTDLAQMTEANIHADAAPQSQPISKDIALPPPNPFVVHHAPTMNPVDYSLNTFGNDMSAIKWDGIGTFAAITALGVKSWKWGNTGFHFHHEKWFQKDRSSIGMDKLGHAYSSYVMTNLFAEHLQRKGRPNDRSALSAALLTQALMLYVETFDGFSTDHGFAYEDVIMNLTGTTLAYMRQRYPAIKDLIDYRMEYSPSGNSGNGLRGFRPVSDYSGQKYLLALKFNGIPALRNTPLKYFELNTGYYARGFHTRDIANNEPRTRTAFVGIGINLNQLLFGKPESYRGDESVWSYSGRKFFEYVQLPTYARVEKRSF